VPLCDEPVALLDPLVDKLSSRAELLLPQFFKVGLVLGVVLVWLGV
jgi:hypothetical protein